MRRHIKKHPGQTDTPKTIMYEIKQMSPEPQRPNRQRKKFPITTKPYPNSPTNTNDYLYQQSLSPEQRPIPWQLIPTDIPENTRKDFPANPKDPQLSLQDLEEMNRQLLAELEVSSSSSDSSLESPTPDIEDLQDRPEDWLILDEF